MLKKIIFPIFFAVAPFAFADDARESLISLLENVQTLSSDFEQRTFKDTSAHVEISTGQFTLEKPLKFNWTVVKPFEQQVISDGETLWVYDPDLEQATYQALNVNIQHSPAMILVQPRQAIGDQYQVFETTQDQQRYYKLVPLDSEGSFVELTMVFDNGLISEIRILDSLGQETLVSLTHVQADTAVDTSLFEFNPPPGTDLFEQM